MEGLSRDQKEIRSSTEPVRILAQKYGVREGRIYELKRGEGWKHIV